MLLIDSYSEDFEEKLLKCTPTSVRRVFFLLFRLASHLPLSLLKLLLSHLAASMYRVFKAVMDALVGEVIRINAMRDLNAFFTY